MRAAVPQRPDTITAHHPRIEIAGGQPGGLSMEGRIDVVRPAFEPLYPQAAPGKGPHERDARRGLALARTGRGDAEGVECRMLHRLFPFPDASKRLSNRDSIHAKVLGERGWGFREGKLFFRRVLLPNSNLLHILLNIPPRLVHGPGVRDRARAADDDEGGTYPPRRRGNRRACRSIWPPEAVQHVGHRRTIRRLRAVP